MDFLNLLLQAAFFAVFAVVLVRWSRERTAVNFDVLAVFAAFAGLFAIELLRVVVSTLPSWAEDASGVMLLAQPWLALRLTRHFDGAARRAGPVVFSAFVVSAILLVVVTDRVAAVIAFEVGYFVVVDLLAALLLARAARRRVGNARLRMWVAAAATACFAIGVLVAGAGAAAATDDGAASPAAATISRLFALVAGIGYLAAFLPPRWVRRLQQRAMAFDLARDLVSAPTGTAVDTLFERLAATALRVTGARASVVVLTESGNQAQAVAGSWQDAPIPGEPVDLTPGPVDGTAAMPGASLLPRAGTETLIAVPLVSDARRAGWLFAFSDRGALFAEDDRALLSLLGSQTIRAVEREDALRQRAVLVTELRETSDELERSRSMLESEARFRVALEAHPSPLLVASTDGRIVYATGRAQAVFGYGADELQRLAIGNLLPGVDLSTEPVATVGARVFDAVRKDGSRFPAELAVSSFAFQGQQLAIAVLEDITERLEIDQLREKFIGVLSHELRTPVTAIYGGTQLLVSRRGRLPPETEQEIIADIAAEGERLHRLIENTLVLARIERRRELEGGDPVLLQRLLPTVIERERGLWPDAQITLLTPPNLPTASGDDAYVGQVVRNLISNAAKYGGSAGVIDVEARTAPDAVEVTIRDRGPGIDTVSAERLFELYYREPSLSAVAPGAGIGLFVCRQIVHALGGRIWARPRDGGGAEFGFALPLYAVDDDAQPVAAPAGSESFAAS